MIVAADEILASHRTCLDVTRQAGSNFPAAFRLLPPLKRQAMHALYAFMRHSDDLADNPPPGHSARELLRHWREAFEQSLSVGTVSGDVAAGTVDPCGRAILPAVIQTIRDFRIPSESLLAVLDGVEMDLEPRVYATFDELALYCERVASAVGLACIHVWGFFRGDASEPARGTSLESNILGPSRSAGLALQLTNILRDLSEDTQRGRVYVPLDDIRSCGYSTEELQRRVVNRSFLRLMEMEIERAEQFYREAAELFRSLHKDGQRIFGLMMETYHALLRAIHRHPADVFTRRIRVSRWKKLWLAARWSLLPVKRAPD